MVAAGAAAGDCDSAIVCDVVVAEEKGRKEETDRRKEGNGKIKKGGAPAGPRAGVELSGRYSTVTSARPKTAFRALQGVG